MTDFYKFIIFWISLGVVGAAFYMYAEHLNKEDITIKDMLLIIIAGMSFGIFMFTIALALLMHAGLNRLDKIVLFQRKRKAKKLIKLCRVNMLFIGFSYIFNSIK